jgi:hypothetical protein
MHLVPFPFCLFARRRPSCTFSITLGGEFRPQYIAVDVEGDFDEQATIRIEFIGGGGLRGR